MLPALELDGRLITESDEILAQRAANLACARLFRYAPMLSPGKARELHEANWLCDNRAFTHATGWRPEVDLEHGAAALYS